MSQKFLTTESVNDFILKEVEIRINAIMPKIIEKAKEEIEKKIREQMGVLG